MVLTNLHIEIETYLLYIHTHNTQALKFILANLLATNKDLDLSIDFKVSLKEIITALLFVDFVLVKSYLIKKQDWVVAYFLQMTFFCRTYVFHHSHIHNTISK